MRERERERPGSYYKDAPETATNHPQNTGLFIQVVICFRSTLMRTLRGILAACGGVYPVH